MGFIDSVLASIERVSSDDALQYGRKGMRWGVRTQPDGTTKGEPVAVKAVPGKGVKTSGGKGVAPSADAIDAATKKQVAKKSTTDALSNKELQAVVTRMQLEASYKRLSDQTKSPGRAFIEKLIKNPNERDKFLEAAGNSPVTKQFKDAMSVGDTIGKTDLSKIGK